MKTATLQGSGASLFIRRSAEDLLQITERLSSQLAG